MQGLDVRNVVCFTNVAESGGRVFEQLRFPLRDEVGMDIELLRQLRDGEFTANREQRYFRLECR